MPQSEPPQESAQSAPEQFAQMFEQLPGFVAILRGPTHVFELTNPAYQQLIGDRQVIGRSVAETLQEAEGQGYIDLLDQVYQSGEAFKSIGAKFVVQPEPGGPKSERFLDFAYQPLRDANGTVTGIFAGGSDVTDRVKAEIRRETLVSLTDKFSDFTGTIDLAYAACEILGEALNVSRVGYGTIDPVAETLHVERDWNAPGVETLAGVLPLRAYGSFIDSLKRGEFISIDDVELDERTAGAADALKGRNAYSFVNVPVMERNRLVAVLFVNHGEVRQWSPADLAFIQEVAGRTRVAVERSRVDAELRELNDTLQERIVQALREQSTMEDALRQSQKMEAVGQLTGGLAHDFNNLLAGILGSLELMQTRLQQGRINDVERYMAAAQGASKRAAALTHRLLAFSRRQTLDPKPTDVNRLVTGMQELIQRTIGPSIALEFVGASGLWPALVDSSQLENSLLNLCINARDAMPDGGRITIETANKWLDERAARQQDIPQGQYLSVCVTDTGTGISPDIIGKVFEPFFTTKPLGEGTGLGLSMIYGFAQQSGGQVRIYSEVGEGTTVCIYLPRHYGEIADESHRVERSPLASSAHNENVLVVDDEPTVRMLITDILGELGYNAIEAGDSVAGLKVLLSDVRIDLLVTDVGLPGGLNGRQMADAARKTRPELPVLFITGYAENAVVSNGHLAPGMAVLTKPFAIDEMAARIRSIIEAVRQSQKP